MDIERDGQIESLLEKAEIDEASKELMRKFFNSISAQSQYNKIVSLLSRFPALFDNFCNCFVLKKEFMDQGKTEEEWNELLASEKDVFSKLEE